MATSRVLITGTGALLVATVAAIVVGVVVEEPRAKLAAAPAAATRLTPAQETQLRRARVEGGTLSFRAEQRGVRFYTAMSTRGGRCFITGAGSETRFAAIACYPRGANIPSAASPIVDFSAGTARLGDRYPRARSISGFAAAVVSSIEVIDDKGVSHRFQVEAGIYASGPLRTGIATRALVAYDRSGRELVRRTALSQNGLPVLRERSR